MRGVVAVAQIASQLAAVSLGASQFARPHYPTITIPVLFGRPGAYLLLAGNGGLLVLLGVKLSAGSSAIIPYFASYGETTFPVVPRRFNSSVSHHPCLVSAPACNSWLKDVRRK